MYFFGEKSKRELATCDLRLQIICNRAILARDFSVLKGFRNEKDQNKAFADGFSKVAFPFGDHNKLPSDAIDLAPYPWDFTNPDMPALYVFAGFILGIAHEHSVALQWGGDWDMDNDLHDQEFFDLYHFAVVHPSRKN